jgi:hypothetical protein
MLWSQQLNILNQRIQRYHRLTAPKIKSKIQRTSWPSNSTKLTSQTKLARTTVTTEVVNGVPRIISSVLVLFNPARGWTLHMHSCIREETAAVMCWKPETSAHCPPFISSRKWYSIVKTSTGQPFPINGTIWLKDVGPETFKIYLKWKESLSLSRPEIQSQSQRRLFQMSEQTTVFSISDLVI